LYAFWDSSERNDPGLNIALYANSTADKILTQLRSTSDDATRANLYAQFEAQLNADIPAIFLYAPDFVYIVPNNLQGLNLGLIETPSDRFLSVPDWHVETDAVWPLLARQR
jgi:peptide/nickel transport system substrate-binding protein